MEEFEECKPRIIAFLDILGIKNSIEKSNTNADDDDEKRNDKIEQQKALFEVYKEILSLKKMNGDKPLQEYLGLEDLQITVFSDSIVISVPYTENNIWSFCRYIFGVQVNLLSSPSRIGYFIRGGITIGNLYHKSDMIFGKAYLDAYELESKLAIYPRIIINEHTVEDIKSKLDDMLRIELEKIVKKDFDGFYYLDYIKDIYSVKATVATDRIDALTEKGLGQERDKKIKQKMDWVLTKISALEKQ